MTASAHNITSLSDRLTNLAEDYKADVASVIKDAKEFEVDPAAIRRLASWKRMDPVKRAEREALDDQYRFLAGELPTPATLPPEGELATAVRLFNEKMTVRDVAAEMGIAVGKAHRLKTQAAAFAVHVQVNVNAPASDHRLMLDGDIGEWLPSHDPETGELPRDMCEADLGDYALIKPRVRVERPKKPEEDFSEKVRRMIADAGLKPQTEPPGKYISDEDANRALEEAIALRRPRERVTA